MYLIRNDDDLLYDKLGYIGMIGATHQSVNIEQARGNKQNRPKEGHCNETYNSTSTHDTTKVMVFAS